MANFDRVMNNVENSLSYYAAVPIIGTAPAALKVVMGSVQTISALAINIPSRIFGSKAIVDYSWTHVKHGIGNVVAGSIEAIPVVGSIAYGARKICGSDFWTMDVLLRLDTGHNNKFMPYESLVAEDFVVNGCCDGKELRDLQSKVDEIKRAHTNAMSAFIEARTYLRTQGVYGC